MISLTLRPVTGEDTLTPYQLAGIRGLLKGVLREYGLTATHVTYGYRHASGYDFINRKGSNETSKKR